MTQEQLIEKLKEVIDLIHWGHFHEPISILSEIIKDMHLNTLYPDQVPYRDTLGRLKFAPIEQSNECVHLCSCCKVIE